MTPPPCSPSPTKYWSAACRWNGSSSRSPTTCARLLLLRHGVTRPGILGYPEASFSADVRSRISVSQLELAGELLLDVHRQPETVGEPPLRTGAAAEQAGAGHRDDHPGRVVGGGASHQGPVHRRRQRRRLWRATAAVPVTEAVPAIPRAGRPRRPPVGPIPPTGAAAGSAAGAPTAPTAPTAAPPGAPGGAAGWRRRGWWRPPRSRSAAVAGQPSAQPNGTGASTRRSRGTGGRQRRRGLRPPARRQRRAASDGGPELLHGIGARVREQNQMSLAASVERAQEAVVADDRLTMTFAAGDRYHGGKVANAQQTVASAASEILGRPVSVGVDYRRHREPERATRGRVRPGTRGCRALLQDIPRRSGEGDSTWHLIRSIF